MCSTFLLCIANGAGFPGCLSWLHTTHHSKQSYTLNKTTVVPGLKALWIDFNKYAFKATLMTFLWQRDNLTCYLWWAQKYKARLNWRLCLTINGTCSFLFKSWVWICSGLNDNSVVSQPQAVISNNGVILLLMMIASVHL